MKKRALAFVWPVSDSACAGRHVGVDVCAGVSSPYTSTHTHIHVAHRHIHTRLNYDVTKMGSLL